MRFALSQRDLDWFEYLRGIAANVGFHMEIIGVEQIRRLNPFINVDGVLAGAWTRDDGHADPSGLSNAMARGARNLGARIVSRNRVLDINALPSGEWRVVTEQGAVTAEMVVNAAGCYRPAGGRGWPVPMRPSATSSITIWSPAQCRNSSSVALRKSRVMRDPYASAYLRQEQKSGLIGIYEQAGQAEAWPPDGLPAWESESELFQDDLERLMPWLGPGDGADAGG